MYTEISLNEMQQLLAGWDEVNGSSSTREYVYEKMINEEPKIVIKVYTSISKNNDSSREKGQDAIRVCAVDLTNRRGWIKTVRVLRVNGWRNNLSKAISSVTFQSNKRLTKNHLAPVTIHFASQEKNEKFKFITETHEPKKPAKLFHPCWTICKEKVYATEASTLDANKEKYRRDTCPHCGGQYKRENLIKTQRDSEQEIQFWEFNCPHCQSNLTVFND